MARYMLDTDIATYVIRGKMPALDERIASVAAEELCISAVTRGELLYGIKLKVGAHRLSRLVDQFLERVSCLPWDAAAATHFAIVAVELHRAGTAIGSMDTMIAGHAIALGSVLVTNNERHFSRVTGLKVENWTRRQDDLS
jgi:tRNA(fMet)-specific endonuclease VapC